MNSIYLFFITTYILVPLAIRWLPAHPIEKRLATTTDMVMEMGYSYVFILCAISSLSALAIWLFMYLRLRKQFPALADAS